MVLFDALTQWFPKLSEDSKVDDMLASEKTMITEQEDDLSNEVCWLASRIKSWAWAAPHTLDHEPEEALLEESRTISPDGINVAEDSDEDSFLVAERRDEAMDTGYDADDSSGIDSDDLEYVADTSRQREQIDLLEWQAQVDTKAAKQRLMIQSMLEGGWAEDSLAVYMQLNRRGLEAMFPASWKPLFTFPIQLFLPDEDAYFGSQHWHPFSLLADRCLQAYDHRQTTQQSTGAEVKLRKAIHGYKKTLFQSARSRVYGNLREGTLPALLATVVSDRHASAEELEQKALRRVRKLATRLLEWLRWPDAQVADYGKPEAYFYMPPSIFVFIMLGAQVCIAAYDPLGSTDQLRPLLYLDFEKPKFATWNAVALAMVTVHCRDHLMEMKTLRRIPDATPEADRDL